jgi:MFS family permease
MDYSEATADPAFVLITSMWYTRQQQPIVIGYWYSANGIGIAVGGLIGYGIGNVRLPQSPFSTSVLDQAQDQRRLVVLEI